MEEEAGRGYDGADSPIRERYASQTILVHLNGINIIILTFFLWFDTEAAPLVRLQQRNDWRCRQMIVLDSQTKDVSQSSCI